MAAFPGNIHSIVHLADAPNLVPVEWTFRAVHRGDFAGHPASGRTVEVPGGSFYEYDLQTRLITAGRIYFDRGTLLRQIGKPWGQICVFDIRGATSRLPDPAVRM